MLTLLIPTAVAIADCSAHVVSRNEAFSTLHPVTTKVSGTSPTVRRIAAPTRKRLYGECEFCAACLARSRNSSIKIAGTPLE